ncbi:MAG: hypothetical protein LBH74_05625 [Nitrososphaerota archaeon]|jgi:hypothetical protein|nr:hypothetical protein [Nitrososphaerota archaeon]
MKVVKTKVGNTEILIQTIEDERLGLNLDQTSGRRTEPTASKNIISSDAFEKAKNIIIEIAKEVELGIKEHRLNPSKFEIALSLSLSANAKFWIIGGEASSILKVKMQWAKDQT